jgi:hypothetical protein
MGKGTMGWGWGWGIWDGMRVGNMGKGLWGMGVGEMSNGIYEGRGGGGEHGKGNYEDGGGEMGIGNVGMRVGEMEWDEEYEPYRDVCGAYEEGECEDRGRGGEEGK